MAITVRAIIFFLGLIFLANIIRLVSKKKLLLKYSLLWMLLALIMMICALFPEPIFVLSKALGVELASNFIFIVAIVCLLAICLSLSIVVSKQTAYTKTLIQEIAIINDRLARKDNSACSEDPRAI